MIRRALKTAALALAALAAGGCLFTDPQDNPGPIAGGTIETTNGLVVIGGRPAARVKVFLLDEENWLANVKDGKGVALDSAETDSLGAFTVKRDTGSKVSFMCNAEGHGVLLRHFTKDMFQKQYYGKVSLIKHVTYKGRVGVGSTGATEILLPGTPFSAPVNENGEFTISNVPPEKYPVVIKRKGPEQVEEFVIAGEVDLTKPQKPDSVPPDTLRPDTSKSVLLEDFKDGDNRSLLGPLLGDGYWDAYSDAHLGGNAVLTQPVNAAPQNFMTAIKDGGEAGRENSLEVAYVAGDRGNDWKPYSFVHLDVNLGPGVDGVLPHYNLSKMDTLSFWAKGSGRLTVEFIQNQLGIPLWVTAGGSVQLTDQWQLFKIAAADMEVSTLKFPANPAQYRTQLTQSGLPAYTQKPAGYAETGGKFRTVTFLGNGGSTFWIDDIRFQGLVLDDLLK